MASILIADDDEIVAELASEVLINAGHACGWVTDGEKVLDLLKWRRPDLLLLDQDMPGMTGSNVLRKLRGSKQFYDLPIIMFTAVTGATDEEAARFHGAQDYIRKPFDPKFLVWRVNGVLRARSERSHRDLMEEMERASGQWVEAAEPRRTV